MYKMHKNGQWYSAVTMNARIQEQMPSPSLHKSAPSINKCVYLETHIHKQFRDCKKTL